MSSLKQIVAMAWLLLLAGNAAHAGTNDFRQQAITLPGNAWASRFADLNQDGRFDLLAVDAEEKKLFIFTSGLPASPTLRIRSSRCRR